MAMALRIDPKGYQTGNVNDLAIYPATLVTGINNNIWIFFGKGPFSPILQLCIQSGRKPTDRGRGELFTH